MGSRVSPPSHDGGTTTALVLRLAEGEDLALGLLWTRIHERVRLMAARALRREGPEPTLEPTELVNEVWLRLHPDGPDGPSPWRNRAHFFGSVARSISQVLIDRGRARKAVRRGGGMRPRSLVELVDEGGLGRMDDDPEAMQVISAALDRLTQLQPRPGEVAWLRLVIGLTAAQAADTLGIGTRTVDEDWAFARAWLRERLQRDGYGGG